MTEDEKALYDEEDPEVPVDLFTLWAKTEFADDEAENETTAEIAGNEEEAAEVTGDGPEAVAESVEVAGNDTEAVVGEAIADDVAPETTEATLDDDELAYLTNAGDAVEMPAEQETNPEFADDRAEAVAVEAITDDATSESAEMSVVQENISELTSDETEAVVTEAIADDETEAVVEQEQIADTPAELNELADDNTEAAVSEAIADDVAPETAETTLNDNEVAYLTSADSTAEMSAVQETVSELTDDRTEVAIDQEQIAEFSAELDDPADDKAEATVSEAITDDAASDSAEATLGDDELAYLTDADSATEMSAEQETVSALADDESESVADRFLSAATDVTNDDLDDLIDVPILPLPAESTEVTDDDLASIRAPILSPGDPVSIPSLTGQTDSAVPPTELSSPSIVEIVQEQEAIETLGNLTAPKVTDPLALFKKLRDLAEELPHNVYYAFKASRMCATLDEIIADFEA